MKSKPIKVMYLIDEYQNPYAGTEGQLFSLIRDLDRKEFCPALTVFRKTEYIESNELPCDVKTLEITKLFSLDTIKKTISYTRSLKKRGINIVHIYFNDPSILFPIFLRLAGIRAIVSRRDMGFWYSPFVLFILRLNSLFLDCVVANSQAVKKLTVEKEYVPEKLVKVIYNGHESNCDSDTQEASIDVRENYEANVKVVGIVANIRPVKRMDVLLRAMESVIKKHPDTILVIVGGGDADSLKKMTREFNIHERVLFTGVRSDAKAVIRQFDVAVLCSDSEGFSNSIIEYMQNHIPVVATNVGGNPELVIDEQTGLLVSPGNHQQLSEKITLLLESPELASSYAANAFKHVSELCDYDNMINQYSRLYRSLIKG